MTTSQVRFLTTFSIFFGLILQPAANVPKNLSLPVPTLCVARKFHTKLNGVNYYFSWLDKERVNLFLNWLDARNFCREVCMDLISLETIAEIQLVKHSMQKNSIQYCWTSGRLCDFKGCDRKDLLPKEINGWFWSGSDIRMRPTNEKSPYNDWSPTGGLKKPQPDNREESIKGGYSESCMAVLNNYYKDGVVWHDVSCGHIKSFVCEDSPVLLKYARTKEPNLHIV